MINMLGEMLLFVVSNIDQLDIKDPDNLMIPETETEFDDDPIYRLPDLIITKFALKILLNRIFENIYTL
jgi:hypothetical protein